MGRGMAWLDTGMHSLHEAGAYIRTSSSADSRLAAKRWPGARVDQGRAARTPGSAPAQELRRLLLQMLREGSSDHARCSAAWKSGLKGLFMPAETLCTAAGQPQRPVTDHARCLAMTAVFTRAGMSAAAPRPDHR